METNLTVGGGFRGYGLGSTPNGFSLLTGLLRAREDDERPKENRRIQPAPDYVSTSWPIRGTMTTTSFVLSHHRKATIEFKSQYLNLLTW